MVVSNRGSLDTACTSNISPDIKLRRWAFLTELDSPPLTDPTEITLISPKGCWCWAGMADKVVEEVPGSDLREPRNGRYVHVG